MTDLKNGIIKINGFVFRPETTKADVLNFFGNKVRVIEFPQIDKVKFLERFYITDNIYSYSFNFDKETGKISKIGLIPTVCKDITGNPIAVAESKLEQSKEWLKIFLPDEIASEDDESICYSYDWGYVIAMVHKDIHYGLLGGEIEIVYR